MGERFVAYQPPAEEKRDPYPTLKLLEQTLRQHIARRLGALSPNWWLERVPQDVRQNAEQRRAKHEKLWPWNDAGATDLVHYLDFTDYLKIITRRDNWEEAFKQDFRQQELIIAKLRELEPIRHAIAHSRDMTKNQCDKLELYANDIRVAVAASR